MLSQPQELLELSAPPPSKSDDLSPTCMSFPQSDPTFFLVGTEEGTIYPCHRYDRAGAKAGIESRISYRGHAAPVMSLAFHPAKGPIDLGDLVLSSSLDWSVKLWRARAPAAASSTAAQQSQSAAPLLEFNREDVVYDAAWSPIKPGIFALVDGAGSLELWDITVDTEVPVTKVQPSARKGAGLLPRSLNKVAWEENDGKKLAVGGLDGIVTVFDVGNELGGVEHTRQEEWTAVKKTVAKLDAAAAGAAMSSTNGISGK
jgi:dynein intermediate chain